LLNATSLHDCTAVNGVLAPQTQTESANDTVNATEEEQSEAIVATKY